MSTRTSPFGKALKEARLVLIPAVLLAVGFNLFASDKVSVPWIREIPQIKEATDSDIYGADTSNPVATIPVDTLPAIDTSLSVEEIEKLRQDSIKAETKRVQDSIAKVRTDSIKAAQDANFGAVENGDVLGVNTKKTKEIFDRKVAVFVDARRSDQFAKGHIPGSINIYASEFAENIPKVANIPRDKLIVVYCDGGLCELSHELANELVTFGFRKVVVYTGGWEEWSKTNYPKTTGE